LRGLAVEVKLPHSLNQLPQVFGQLLLLLRNFAQLPDHFLVLSVDSLLNSLDEVELFLQSLARPLKDFADFVVTRVSDVLAQLSNQVHVPP
jgi:hypothetical protein